MKKNGQSLIELLLTIGLAAIMLPALLTGLITSRDGRSQEQQRVKATSITREIEEAVRSIRNRDWSNIEQDGTYYPIISGTEWASASGTITVDGFTKSYTISDVNRDLNGNIVNPPNGSLDPSTKKITINVTWSLPYLSSMVSTLYLTRWKDNLSYLETTKTQFDAGTKTGVTTRLSAPQAIPTPDDGEILLASGGYGDWCDPNLSNVSLNLPGSASESIIMAAPGTESTPPYNNKAYVGTGGNSSGDPLDYIIINSPVLPTPPSPNLNGQFIVNQFKSYGIFGDNTGTYAYMVTDHPGYTLEIVKLSDYSLVGRLDIGNIAGKSVYVVNNIAFITTDDNKLYTVDVSNPTSPTVIANISLTGQGIKIAVIGSNAYIAIASSSNQLEIVPWSNGGSTFGTPVTINVNGETGVDLTVKPDGTRTYLITSVSATKPELFIIDTDPTSPTYKQTKGSYDTSSYGNVDPKGIAIVPGNIALLGGVGNPSGNQSYQVINISNESSPTNCKPGFSPGFDIKALATVTEGNGDVFTYAIAATDPEFRIIIGGPGGGFASNGIFESQTKDVLRQTADNRFIANFSQPPGTSISFQVSLANLTGDPPTCPSTFTFVGPNGSLSDWFTPASGSNTFTAPFPLGSYGANYSNPGQCFRYKVNFVGDGSSSPVLYDFTINYSP